MSWYLFVQESGSSGLGFQPILPCAHCFLAGMYGSQISISWVNWGGTLSSSIIEQKISVVALLQSRRWCSFFWIWTADRFKNKRVVSGKTYKRCHFSFPVFLKKPVSIYNFQWNCSYIAYIILFEFSSLSWALLYRFCWKSLGRSRERGRNVRTYCRSDV